MREEILCWGVYVILFVEEIGCVGDVGVDVGIVCEDGVGNLK